MEELATVKARLYTELELAMALIRIELMTLSQRRMQEFCGYLQHRVDWLETRFMYNERPASAPQKRRAPTKRALRKRR